MPSIYSYLKFIFALVSLFAVSCESTERTESQIGATSPPGKSESASLPHSVDLNIFMHDSKSMNGFRFLGSQMGDEIHSFFNNLEDPQNQIIKSISSYKLSTEREVSIVSLGGGINALADHIQQTNKTDGTVGPVLKGVNKDYSKMADAVIEKTFQKPNTISAFVSDLVYYPGDAEGKDLKAYLGGQSERIRTTFQTALAKHSDLCVVLLRGVSDYKWDQKVTPQRPFYLLIFGKKNDLQPVMGFAQKNWKGKHFWFELIKKTETPRVVVARGHNWAKGSYDTDHREEQLIKKPNQRNGTATFSFVSEVDLKEFKGLDYLVTNQSRYKGGAWKVDRVGRDPGYTVPNIKDGYQFEISTKGNLNPSEFQLTLPYQSPNWIANSSHTDFPTGPISDPKYSDKTFGLEPLINGIVQAYHIGDKDLIHLKFRITK